MAFPHNDYFQVLCTEETPERRFTVEWEIYELCWQFAIENVSEERLLALLRRYWRKGVLGIEMEDDWVPFEISEKLRNSWK